MVIRQVVRFSDPVLFWMKSVYVVLAEEANGLLFHCQSPCHSVINILGVFHSLCKSRASFRRSSPIGLLVIIISIIPEMLAYLLASLFYCTLRIRRKLWSISVERNVGIEHRKDFIILTSWMNCEVCLYEYWLHLLLHFTLTRLQTVAFEPISPPQSIRFCLSAACEKLVKLKAGADQH